MPILTRLAVALLLVVGPLAVTVTVTGHAHATSSSGPGAARLTASWSTSTVVSGKRATVSGSVRPAGAVARVVLQRRMPDGWQSVASVRPSTSKYALRVPTGWYSALAYRVKAVGAAGVRSTYSTSKRIRIVPAYTPRGSAKSHSLIDDPIARWDSCAPIGYRVNLGLAKAGALRDVKGALRRVYQATGLRFVHRGRTAIVPGPHASYPGDTDLVIGWARPSDSDLLGGGGGPLGVGGASWTSGFRNADGTPASKIDSGFVVLDASQQGRTPGGFGTGQTRGELLMHEIGHAIGLQHVNDPRQLMHPWMQRSRARWGAGDLAGLRSLGANQGCLKRA
jgi:hypothetical protein